MEPVPTDLGKQFNFTFDVGAGVQVVLTSNLLLTVGYRYHHLSNGFRGQINPGVDASLFHFGVAMAR
jgi:opacity protein-like surface antigen